MDFSIRRTSCSALAERGDRFELAPEPFEEERLALKTLLMPGGLGSTHKVLILGKGVGTPTLQRMLVPDARHMNLTAPDWAR